MSPNVSGLITSRNHALLRPIRSLHRREERDRAGLFFAEGIRFVSEAVDARARIETLVIAPELLTQPYGRKLAQRLERAGVATRRVTAEVFHSLALTDSPQGIGIVARQHLQPLATAPVQPSSFWVALGHVQSAGNLGTIIRTCEAAGASGLLLVESNADPYDPSAVRASMGAVFRQRFYPATHADLRRWKARRGVCVAGTALQAALDYHQAAYEGPMVLFMGSERQGLSPAEQELCDLLVRIPMVGHADSLNVAVAAGVMMYEVFNQRRAVLECSRSEEPVQPTPAHAG